MSLAILIWGMVRVMQYSYSNVVPPYFYKCGCLSLLECEGQDNIMVPWGGMMAHRPCARMSERAKAWSCCLSIMYGKGEETPHSNEMMQYFYDCHFLFWYIVDLELPRQHHGALLRLHHGKHTHLGSSKRVKAGPCCFSLGYGKKYDTQLQQ